MLVGIDVTLVLVFGRYELVYMLSTMFIVGDDRPLCQLHTLLPSVHNNCRSLVNLNVHVHLRVVNTLVIMD